MALDPAWIALIGTVCGGIGLKVVEHWLSKNKVRTDDATQIRNELRERIVQQDAEIKELEATAEKFRDQYYKLYEKYLEMQQLHNEQIQNIQREVNQGAEAAQAIDALPPPTPPTNVPGTRA